MNHSAVFLGVDLLADLRVGDGVGEAQAREWIATKSHRPYDARSIYLLTWSDGEDLKTWAEYGDLRVQVAADEELEAIDASYREQRGLAPRAPGEPRIVG